MAKRRGKNRGPNRSTQREQMAQMAQQRARGLQSQLQLSDQVSAEVNQQIQEVMGNMDSLRNFYAQAANDNAEVSTEMLEHQEFLVKSKEKVDTLLSLDPTVTYNKFIRISIQRQQFYKKVVKDGVVNNDDLAIFSDHGYLEYLSDLNNRRANPDKLDVSDLQTLQNARHDTIDAILTNFQTANKITAAEAARLKALGPISPSKLQTAREAFYQKLKAHDVAHSTHYYNEFMQLYRAEEAAQAELDSYTELYNFVLKGVVNDIDRHMTEDKNQKLFFERVRALQDTTGLPLEKGLILYAQDWTVPAGPGGARPQNIKVEITDINAGGAAQIDPDLPATPENMMPSLEPVIKLKIDVHGRTQDLALSASALKQWLIVNKVEEKIDTVEQLETQLQLPTGLIREGQKIEYTLPLKYEEGEEAEQAFASVKIEKIENGLIHFNAPINISQSTNAAKIAATVPKTACTFAEFAKWYRQNEAVPEGLEIAHVDQCLAIHHKFLVKQMKWPDSHGSPISLAAGPMPLYLKSAYNQNDEAVVVTSIEPHKVNLEKGESMTPGQFLRFVKSEGLTRPNKEQMAELIKIAENKQDAAKASKLKEEAAKFELAKDKGTVKEDDKPAVPHKKGYWSDLWANTHFLNLLEVYQLLVETPLGRMKDKLKDLSERKVAAVGKELYKGLPNVLGLADLAGKSEDKLNSKVAEDVKNKLDYFEKNSTDEEVFNALYSAQKPTVYKAAMQFLTKKGIIRWEDDEKLMAVTNRLFPYAKYDAKYHEAVGKDTPVVVGDKNALAKDKNLNIFEQYRRCIDSQYGDGTFDGFEKTNARAYDDRRNYTKDNMHNFEFLGGRIGNTLKKMLLDFESGKDIDPAEFEGLLMGATAGLEFASEQALMFFIAAFGMKRPKDGKTILTYSRMRFFWPVWKDQIMWLYFNLNYNKLDENGKPIMVRNEITGKEEPIKDKLRMNDFNRFYETIIKKDISQQISEGKKGLDKFTAGKHTIAWLQGEVIAEDKVTATIGNKAGGAAPLEVYHYIGPRFTTTTQIEKIIRKSWGSTENDMIIKNMYAGYNNQMLLLARKIGISKSEAERNKASKDLANMLYCYIFFNNALRGKIGDKNQYMKVTDSILDSRGSADSERDIRLFHDELIAFSENFCVRVAQAAGKPDLAIKAHEILNSSVTRVDEATEEKFREEMKTTIIKFSQENPAKFSKIALENSDKLKGMSGATLSKAEREEEELKQAA